MVTWSIQRRTLAGFFGLIIATFLLDAQTITHGPFVGGVTSTSAKFYVRTTDSANVNVQLSRTTDFAPFIAGVPTQTAPERDSSAIIQATGLAPETKYYYRITVNGTPRGEVRSFMTFPAPGTVEPFTFTFGSCQQSGPQRFFSDPVYGRVYDQMVRDNPRFFLQIGDWTYPDTTGPVFPIGNTRLQFTLDYATDYDTVLLSYRAKYDTSYQMQKLLRVAPVDYIYDDHDFGWNNSDGQSATPQQRQNSIRGYGELFPGYPHPNPNDGIWHKFTFGNADFFMLDLRSCRDKNAQAFDRVFFDPPNNYMQLVLMLLGLDSCKPRFSPQPGHSILSGFTTTGEDQRTWLLRELKNSTARWKFLTCTVPFNKAYERVIDTSCAIYAKGTKFIDDPVNGQIPVLAAAIEVSDKWAGFPKDIDTVLSTIRQNNIKNVIVLSGDIHTAGIDDGANAGLPEICAGGLDMENSKTILLLERFGIWAWDKGAQDSITKNFYKAYGRVQVFGNDSVRLSVVDEFGALVTSYTVKDSMGVTQVAEGEAIPTAFALYQNYPNPFNPSTSIRFDLPSPGQVSLKVYDVLGQEVADLISGNLNAGTHRVEWNAGSRPSGTYFCRFASGAKTLTMKMLLVR